MKDKRKRIEMHLLSNSCNPALKGFKILTDAISDAMEDPSLNTSELFNKCALKYGIQETAAYRSAKYCLDNSLSPEKRMLPFIRAAVINLENRE